MYSRKDRKNHFPIVEVVVPENLEWSELLGPSQVPYAQHKAYGVPEVQVRGPPACHCVFLTDPCLWSLCLLCLSPLSRYTLGS